MVLSLQPHISRIVCLDLPCFTVENTGNEEGNGRPPDKNPQTQKPGFFSLVSVKFRIECDSVFN